MTIEEKQIIGYDQGGKWKKSSSGRRSDMDLESYREHQKVLVAVDCIIFGFDGTQLQALLIKRGFEPEKGKWSLMGGFVGEDEDADQAAIRVLYQLTGMKDVYMEQLHIFSRVDRDKAGRVISIAYFALVNLRNYNEQIQAGHKAKWFPLSKIPALVFDHKKMISKAKQVLRDKIANHPIGFELLPKKFTLLKLFNLYEVIYETQLDKRNFIKKMLSIGILNKLPEKEKGFSKKGSFYYVFDSVKYHKLKINGIKFVGPG